MTLWTLFDGDQSGDLRPRQTPESYTESHPYSGTQASIAGLVRRVSRRTRYTKTDENDIAILAGNLVTPSMRPYAACYAGHQFGNWAGQLGDGRAITLGEWETPEGKTWELQLKGPGPTPYSRRADGRAVLRSSLREYLMSEAMYYLDVPTTRALSLVTTGEQVLRDMFYDGRPEFEPGAIVMRAAPSFLRFGNYEMLAARQEISSLRKLIDWTIGRFYPHIGGEDKIIPWFREVVERTASLMAEWLRVGFVHGVMNTDNMSILGLTIDYGPFSFVDDYDPNFTPNTTDLPGRRYAFGKQPSVAYWNLGCLANAIAPLVPDRNQLVSELKAYNEVYQKKYYAMMGNKLGLDQVRLEDIQLITQFEKTLTLIKPDMTIFYQLLMDLPVALEGEQAVADHFAASFYNPIQAFQRTALFSLIHAYGERIKTNTCTRQDSLARMRKNNPRFILRNYLLHQAIEELEGGEGQLFATLQEAIKEPYSQNFDQFFAKRPAWASRKAGCSMLSCSS